MPELPEVETTRRGIAPHLQGRRIHSVEIRQPRLRWPVPDALPAHLRGHTVQAVERRAKYLLLRLTHGTVLLHLGMSGSLSLVAAGTPGGKHDHVDFTLDSGLILRLHDPRRFGAVLWVEGDPHHHPLLEKLGPEPLGEDFSGAWLHAAGRGRSTPVKPFLMDSKFVVGVGNIYASESLFRAGIHPARRAGAISRARYERLADAIREVLQAAIDQGGTTLRDFLGGDGRPGYFAQQLQVYGRGGAPCPQCHSPIRQLRQAQRSTWYCPRCQR